MRKNLSNKRIDQAVVNLMFFVLKNITKIEQLKSILSFAPKNIEAQNLLNYCMRENGQNKEEIRKNLEAALEVFLNELSLELASWTLKMC